MKLIPQGHAVKDWGLEINFASNESYCGKLLVFEYPKKKTAMLLHKTKRKSWFVNSGSFKITFIDIKTGVPREQIVKEGNTVDIAEMSPHQLESLEHNSTIFETGSADYEEDQFRLNPGDEQIQPSEQ
jgi:hypothetical protein|tara:strand:+ start:4700 stop:5083 length:384 start_codon:yes stop_codon:yes gene_type:complete